MYNLCFFIAVFKVQVPGCINIPKGVEGYLGLSTCENMGFVQKQEQIIRTRVLQFDP